MDIFPQLILNSIIAGAIYTLVVLSFNFIYGTTKFFNLAHGVMAAIGGYTVFYFAKTLGLNVYITIILGIAIAGFSKAVAMIPPVKAEKIAVTAKIENRKPMAINFFIRK